MPMTRRLTHVLKARGPKPVRYFRYLRRQVAPRAWSIVRHPNFVGALAVAALIGVFRATSILTEVSGANARLSSIATAALAFAGLGFGGSMTAVALALTVPRERVVVQTMFSSIDGPNFPVTERDGKLILSGTSDVNIPESYRSLYSDFIFVFTWAMYTQLAIAVTSGVVMLFASDRKLAPPYPMVIPSILVALYLFVLVYGVLQLFSSVRALTEYASNRERFARADVVMQGFDEK